MVQKKLTEVSSQKVTHKAEELAKHQREISVSEFFTRNRHLLGFDNPRKALLMVVKEAVDNSFDACQEMQVLPQIIVEIKSVDGKEDQLIVAIEDNGPGIVREQVPRIFGKLLYGSKFGRLKQGMGAQGIGISAAVMYAQLTTGKPAKITTIIGKGKPAHYLELHLDTQRNEPEIVKDEIVKWNKEHGTRIELQIEGKYLKGKQSVDEYLKLISISNPHSEIIYTNPLGEKVVFARGTKQLPVEPKEIKPHPYGVELGILLKMMKATSARNLNSFLTNDFSRVSSSIAAEISKLAGFSGDEKPSELSLQDAEKLFQAIPKVKIMAPPTNCLSPIGEEQLIEGLKKEVQAEFYAAVTRKPSVYRGFPFFVECAVAYGGDLPGDELISVYRYANKVPLLYQQSACSIYKSVAETMWRNYGLSQSKGALPVAPLVLVVHVASVWVPFTSESKEAVAHYPEIIKEVKLALQDTGRKLNNYIRKTVKAREAAERFNLFEKYIPELASSLAILSGEKKEKINDNLLKILKKQTPVLLENLNA